MDFELITIEPQNALTIFTTPKAIDPFIDMVREAVNGFSGDISTAKGRAEIKSMAHKVTKVKTHIEAVGKQLSAEQKELPKKIDATRRIAWDALEALADDVRRPVTEWEAAEDARVKAHEDALAALAAMGAPTTNATAADLRRALEAAQAITAGPERQEYEEAFARTKDATIASLSADLVARETYEAEQAELAAHRAAAAEREAKEREAQIARDAAERAVRAEQERAENERKAAEQKAQQERDAAERREADLKRQADDAERRAAEAEANAQRRQEQQRLAEQAEADRRQQDKEHRKSINGAALAALVAGGIAEDTARAVLKLIIIGAVPNVTINY